MNANQKLQNSFALASHNKQIQ